MNYHFVCCRFGDLRGEYDVRQTITTTTTMGHKTAEKPPAQMRMPCVPTLANGTMLADRRNNRTVILRSADLSACRIEWGRPMPGRQSGHGESIDLLEIVGLLIVLTN